MNPPAPPEDMLFGSNPILEALRKDRAVSRVWLARGKNDRIAMEIIGHCRKANIPFASVDKAFIDRLSFGVKHQGFAAQTAPKAYSAWREMAAQARGDAQEPLIVLLDEVEDPHNLGAVIRSVDALGAHGVVITKHRAAPLTAGAARASAGAWAHVAVDRVTNLAGTIDEMKKEGFWVIGMTAEADKPITETNWRGPVALVLGGESKGISPLIRKKCDVLACIPMVGQTNSLNVSAAAAVVLYEIGRQRGEAGLSPAL